ncbi:MAG: hypothetical protein M0C28_01975 [Candidatus Moduliflexus flocculans]|nr:hypothetical protein [Candidatus Moduliflexus flocculans]
MLHLESHARKGVFLKKIFKHSPLYLGPVPDLSRSACGATTSCRTRSIRPRSRRSTSRTG